MNNFKAIYKILCLLDKHKGDENFDYVLISASALKTPFEAWEQLMIEIQEAGYIKGLVYTQNLSESFPHIVEPIRPRITLKGMEYLADNSMMEKAGEIIMMKNKYNLTPEQNLFLAKKKWAENVYCGMKMENRAVTFPQTQTILNGVNVPGVTIDDIQAILNMRDAWRYMLDTIAEPITLEYFCKLNEYVARNEALEWGKLRTGSVGISGTDYRPSVPEWGSAETSLRKILEDNVSETEKALNIFLWGARGQFFWDGNKRSSLMLANKELIMAGGGILTITDKHMQRFNELLLEYYNTAEKAELKRYLYDNCIEGIEFAL